ncbi:prepilin-type N-terminal cleavage/methylation domain-containing protein [Malonomonas rubra DSM 5091]|uniref:Prepilin-type N-terminal cleavage/methylation domain-containing protein n=1 Tax=Malonomonas rubra DSM 5091 TaxID=1122189 RepID=A0A1M6IKT1_MALRU|nr:prepilin-type N-terminal cleavage/methylation domain-containing protein [Malonomonas rubra]SHJ35096.1 prepilin-type N-terminal cleavage/methylation domain-containing protein [Malonomonas rubra DSM 5091]
MLTDNKGFTLMELVVAVAILAILAGLSLPPLMQWLSRADYREVSQQVLQALRLGQSQSAARNREYRVVFDLNDDDATVCYQVLEGNRASNSTSFSTVVMTGEDSSLPATVVLRGNANCLGTADITFDFNPDGTSSAGVICIMDSHLLATGDEKFKVRIDNQNTGKAIIE